MYLKTSHSSFPVGWQRGLVWSLFSPLFSACWLLLRRRDQCTEQRYSQLTLSPAGSKPASYLCSRLKLTFSFMIMMVVLNLLTIILIFIRHFNIFLLRCRMQNDCLACQNIFLTLWQHHIVLHALANNFNCAFSRGFSLCNNNFSKSC